MVLSAYLIKAPYWLAWQYMRLFKKLDDIVFYIDSEHDYFLIENVLPYIEKPYKIVARNKKVSGKLRQKGVKVSAWPAFPRLLIMTRHAFHRFPINIVKKIGMRHGPYHFKKMIHPDKYNAFDLFLFTSEVEVEKAQSKGIKSGVSGGYPRLDVFKREDTIAFSEKIKNSETFDEQKAAVLFTATWDKSGLSAVDKWICHLPALVSKYNVFVSLHPMMSENYIRMVKSVKGIQYVQAEELPAYMLASDYLISDTSSVIAEYCALNKAVITFNVNIGGRLTPEISEMIRDVSISIESVDQIDNAIEEYILNPELKKNERERWNKIFFDDIDVSHGEKAARHINDFIKSNYNSNLIP